MFDIPPVLLRDFTSTSVCLKSLIIMIKFIYSERATKFCEISTLEYMNFIILNSDFQQTSVEVKSLRRSGGISNILKNKNLNHFCLFKIQSLNTSIGKNTLKYYETIRMFLSLKDLDNISGTSCIT